MHAVILAGGRGVRLRPYTTTIPKPLVPIGEEYSILEIVMLQLASQGFTSITLAIGHFGHLIRSFVGDGSRWGLSVRYVEERTPLGTIGPLLPHLDRLPQDFLVMNGDVLTDLDFGRVLQGHMASGAPLTVSTFDRSVNVDFGVLEECEGRITAFREKPKLPYRVSMGVYGLSRETLRPYEAGKPFGFDELVLDLIARGDNPRAHLFDGYWLDIGRPEDYDRANADFELMSSSLLPTKTVVKEGTATAEIDLRVSITQADLAARSDHPRVLVVGGTGFIGGHVVQELTQLDAVEVACLTRGAGHTFASSRMGSVPAAIPIVEFVDSEAGQVRLVQYLKEFRPTAVINCAGATSGDLAALTDANVGFTARLIDAIASSEVPIRLVHIGSAAEYGGGLAGVPLRESAIPRPESVYGLTKLAGTEAVLRAAATGRISGVVLRVFNAVGPGAPAGSLLGRAEAEFARVVAEGGPVRLGPLGAFRDFVDVRDVAKAAAAAALHQGDLKGTFNIGRGEAVAVRELVQKMASIVGYQGPIEETASVSPRSAGVEWQCADVARASEVLGWHTVFDLRDTVADLVTQRVTA